MQGTSYKLCGKACSVKKLPLTYGCMCTVLPHTYFHSKRYSYLAKLTYTTCYQLADFNAECLIETQKK